MARLLFAAVLLLVGLAAAQQQWEVSEWLSQPPQGHEYWHFGVAELKPGVFINGTHMPESASDFTFGSLSYSFDAQVQERDPGCAAVTDQCTGCFSRPVGKYEHDPELVDSVPMVSVVKKFGTKPEIAVECDVRAPGHIVMNDDGRGLNARRFPVFTFSPAWTGRYDLSYVPNPQAPLVQTKILVFLTEQQGELDQFVKTIEFNSEATAQLLIDANEKLYFIFVLVDPQAPLGTLSMEHVCQKGHTDVTWLALNAQSTGPVELASAITVIENGVVAGMFNSTAAWQRQPPALNTFGEMMKSPSGLQAKLEMMVMEGAEMNQYVVRYPLKDGSRTYFEGNYAAGVTLPTTWHYFTLSECCKTMGTSFMKYVLSFPNSAHCPLEIYTRRDCMGADNRTPCGLKTESCRQSCKRSILPTGEEGDAPVCCVPLLD